MPVPNRAPQSESKRRGEDPDASSDLDVSGFAGLAEHREALGTAVWSDTDCLEALRAYAAWCKQTETRFTARGYTQWRADRTNLPSVATLLRVTSWTQWRQSAAEADNPLNTPLFPKHHYWAEQDYLSALQGFQQHCRAMGSKTPTIRAYDDWRGNQSSLPCSRAIINHFQDWRTALHHLEAHRNEGYAL